MTKLIVSLDKLPPEKASGIVTEISRFHTWNNLLYKFNDLIALLGFIWIKDLLKDSDIRIMLDPKWNDIPNTISNYFTQLHNSWLAEKTDIITLHANGGASMIRAAVETRDHLGLKTKIFAVTALTSLERTDTQNIYDEDPKHAVLKLTKLALDAWVDGIVCSAQETSILRSIFSDYDFEIMNPWVRFAGGNIHDQKRVCTPTEAVENGANYIVMWRPILQADNKREQVENFFSEVEHKNYTASQQYDFEKKLYTWSWKELLSYIWAFYFRPEWWSYCRLTSKLISNAYINIWSVERNPFVIERATTEMAEKLTQRSIVPDVVMWAQMGSVRISLYLAEKLWVNESVYTEKTNNNNNEMKLKRHDISLKWKKIVISEDVVNRGSTLRYMVDIVNNLWWEVIGIACLANRHGKDNFDGIPLISCYQPEAFELYWDESTPEEQRKDYPRLPENSEVSAKPKNHWDDLVASMRK